MTRSSRCRCRRSKRPRRYIATCRFRALPWCPRAVPDGMEEVHGLRLPGTGLPGVIMVGTWREAQRVTFAVCHGRGPAVVLELTGQRYDRIVVTVENPEDVVA